MALSLSLTLSHSFSHSLCLSLSLNLSLSLSLTLSLTLSLSLNLSLTLSLSHSLSLSLPHSLSLSLILPSLSLTHSNLFLLHVDGTCISFPSFLHRGSSASVVLNLVLFIHSSNFVTPITRYHMTHRRPL